MASLWSSLKAVGPFHTHSCIFRMIKRNSTFPSWTVTSRYKSISFYFLFVSYLCLDLWKRLTNLPRGCSKIWDWVSHNTTGYFWFHPAISGQSVVAFVLNWLRNCCGRSGRFVEAGLRGWRWGPCVVWMYLVDPGCRDKTCAVSVCLGSVWCCVMELK